MLYSNYIKPIKVASQSCSSHQLSFFLPLPVSSAHMRGPRVLISPPHILTDVIPDNQAHVFRYQDESVNAATIPAFNRRSHQQSDSTILDGPNYSQLRPSLLLTMYSSWRKVRLTQNCASTSWSSCIIQIGVLMSTTRPDSYLLVSGLRDTA